MRKAVTALILIPLAILIVMFGVANREAVTISLDPFDSAQWWRNSTDAQTVSREWFGMLNAWVGFPVGAR